MKKANLIWTLLLGTVAALAVYFVTRYSAQSSASPPVSPPAKTLAPSSVQADGGAVAPPLRSNKNNSITPPVAAAPMPVASLKAIAFTAAIDTLTAPKSTYADRQAAWKQLEDAGLLHEAVKELTDRMNADTNDAWYPAELGQAYLKLCATTNDVRSQAVWAMNADALFETALNLDPSNWEARYNKTVAMTYWPANLGKGPEIIEQFNTLLQQQEQQPPQPQFAQTYDWLGIEYERTGQPDLALQTWERGAALFPQNPSLSNHLAGAPVPSP